MKHRAPVFLGKNNGDLGAAGECGVDREDDGPIAIAGIPLRSLRIFWIGGFFQLVSFRNLPIFRQSPFGTPGSVRDSVLNRPIQRSSVSPGLTSADDFVDHEDNVFST